MAQNGVVFRTSLYKCLFKLARVRRRQANLRAPVYTLMQTLD
jgi:hypothetical protein